MFNYFVRNVCSKDAQKIFEVRQRAVTGFAYSIGSNDKIVATSSFTLGSAKHDPSFSRFKFLGQRPFENFENPYSSHLFREKNGKNNFPASPIMKKPVPEPNEKTPAEVTTEISKSNEETTEKETEVKGRKVSETPLKKTEAASGEIEPVEEADAKPTFSPTNIPQSDVTRKVPKLSEADIDEEFETQNYGTSRIASEIVSKDGEEATPMKVPDGIEQSLPDGEERSKHSEKGIPEVSETKILTESSLKTVQSNANTLSPTIPPNQVLVPNSGRVRGVPTIVTQDDNRLSTNVSLND